MASSKLIGTAPDQVPTNADLGELAFQNKDSVEFTGGKGGLSSLDLTAIAASKNVSATDIFVYDTSKDSDGGQWRNRCQNTSWYNETLNTDTRGSRREFPSLAVIVATSSNFTIYDGDDPSLPMWMVMNGGVPTVLYTTLTSLSAINGILCVGTNPNSSNYYDGGVKVISFINDFMRSYSYGYSVMRYAYNIAQRNTSWSGQTNPHQYGDSSGVLLNPNVNDVAMTVLPNAPIDAATGLPIPTIAVATNGGVSIIHNNGSVINAFYSGYGQSTKVFFTAFGGLQMHGGGGIAYRAWGLNSIPMVTTNNFDYKLDDAGWASTQLNRNGGNGNSQLYPCRPTSDGFATREVAGVSTSDKLIVVSQNTTAFGYSLQRYVTTKYNTGWMPGDIKGAWLSDTTQETVVGAELITNGTFDSSTTGWTDNSGSPSNISSVSGMLRLNGTANYARATQVITTVPGRSYVFKADISNITSGQNIRILVGTYGPYSNNISDYYIYAPGTHAFVFTALATSCYVTLFTGWDIYADNVSVRLADADRSVNNKGLQVYGSITKSPVATGADIVAYSGFSGSNYLQQPYNSALDFGAGDFCVMFWHKNPGNGRVILQRCRADQEGLAGSTTDMTQQLYIYTGANNYQIVTGTQSIDTGVSIPTSGWEQAIFARRSNVLCLYINGVLKYTGSNVGSIGAATHVLRIGTGINYNNSPHADSIALVRFSATPPSDDQIKKMYNDEKVLFQDNAKATLYGTSDAVTALAYDQDTKQLHVGTSSGRSVFQGLRRVDNTTTAVSTSISAANGLVAEN